uniref:Uncharacterized protein n=1 Tax=Pyramimonas obovata TaxID=1411642 RepID=A0A7S0WPY6_9CHLO|mmetsp:Transcript_33938/g.74241  ORF Transcript_33938/g.74241 Transcript_33938/m.74241 type:complete len:326 (+) Transcript_33938:142-1119(+)
MAAPRVAAAAAAFLGASVIRVIKDKHKKKSKTDGNARAHSDSESQASLASNRPRTRRRTRSTSSRRANGGRQEAVQPEVGGYVTSAIPASLLPAAILVWVLGGVAPALYFKATEQQALLDRWAPANLLLAMLCISMWIVKALTLRPAPTPGAAQRRLTLAALEEAASAERTRPQGMPPQAAQMAGRWVKARAESQSMDAACDLIHMNFVMKRAVCLISGLHIEATPTEFKLVVTSVVPWFKITETYPWDGSEVQFRRRDFRKGTALGSVREQGDGLEIRNRWRDPYPGTDTCVFSVTGERLVAKTTMRLDTGQTAYYEQVYYRHK